MQAHVHQFLGETHVLHRPAQAEPRAYAHFAHATGFNAETYRAIIQGLDQRIDVYASDWRGHGKTRLSALPQELRSWSQYEQDLQKLLGELPKPIVLAGHSMGATVSLRVAARMPDVVAGVVLVEPVFANPALAPFIQAAYRWSPENRLPLVRAAKMRRAHFDSEASAIDHLAGRGIFKSWPRETVEAYIQGGTKADADGVTWTCAPPWEARTFAVARPLLSERLRAVRCPVTLMVGEQDSTCHPKARDKFQELLPQTKLVTVARGSHFVPMEFPQLVCAEIEKVALGLQAM